MLERGSYRAVLMEKKVKGSGSVEVYGLNHQLDSHLTVMNTLGSVGKGGTALIGDFTLEGSTKGKMLLRALGNGLKDPTLELIDANSSIITAHDNGEHAEYRDRRDGIGPNKRTDSAIVLILTREVTAQS
jgi:hypothetical protein